MNSYWPAIIAVIGTLSGAALSAVIGWVDKERAFRREWLRHQFDKRIEVYNDILRQAQAAVFAIRGAKFLAAQPDVRPDPDVLALLKQSVNNLRDSMSAQTLYCSQAVRDLFNNGVLKTVAIEKQGYLRETEYLAAVEAALTETINQMQQRAVEETSFEEFRKRLRS